MRPLLYDQTFDLPTKLPWLTSSFAQIQRDPTGVVHTNQLNAITKAFADKNDSGLADQWIPRTHAVGWEVGDILCWRSTLDPARFPSETILETNDHLVKIGVLPLQSNEVQETTPPHRSRGIHGKHSVTQLENSVWMRYVPLFIS